MASCFSCFTVKVLKDFHAITVARERIRLAPLKAMPTSRAAPLANAAIEIPPVITVDGIRPVSMMPLIVLNRFSFLAIRHELQFNQAKMPQFQSIFLRHMFVVIVMP